MQIYVPVTDNILNVSVTNDHSTDKVPGWLHPRWAATPSGLATFSDRVFTRLTLEELCVFPASET
jgi:hypothetical protein